LSLVITFKSCKRNKLPACSVPQSAKSQRFLSNLWSWCHYFFLSRQHFCQSFSYISQKDFVCRESFIGKI